MLPDTDPPPVLWGSVRGLRLTHVVGGMSEPPSEVGGSGSPGPGHKSRRTGSLITVGKVGVEKVLPSFLLRDLYDPCL